MKPLYIFDVDGTLTPSRGKIDSEFEKWFEHFATRNAVYFVTGSDRPKTIEQLGKNIYSLAVRVYNCSGNDVWEQDRNIYTSPWTLPTHARLYLEKKLTESKFPLRTGQHIEDRPGLVNFSIVGRGATLKERMMYIEWDHIHNERNNIVEEFRHNFGLTLEISAGGETGMDIYPRGANKSQIIKDFDKEMFLNFFGDRMDKHGNDAPLAVEIAKRNGSNYHVKDWKETWKLLREMA